MMSVIFAKQKVNIDINCLQEISAKFVFGRKDVGNDQGWEKGVSAQQRHPELLNL